MEREALEGWRLCTSTGVKDGSHVVADVLGKTPTTGHKACFDGYWPFTRCLSKPLQHTLVDVS